MKIWGLLLLLVLSSCSKDSWELAPVDSESPKSEGFLFSYSRDDSINNFIELALKDFDGSNLEPARNALFNIGSVEGELFVKLAESYLAVSRDNQSQDKFAEKRAKDDLYNLKYALLFDYRNLVDTGLGKAIALEKALKRSIDSIDDLELNRESDFKEVLKDFAKQVENEEFDLSKEQRNFVSDLKTVAKKEHAETKKQYLSLSKERELSSGLKKLDLKSPRVQVSEMKFNENESFKTRVRLSFFAGENSMGPLVNFLQTGSIQIVKFYDGEQLKAYLCKMQMSARPEVNTKNAQVRNLFFKDQDFVRSFDQSDLFLADEQDDNGELFSTCEEEFFKKVRAKLKTGLRVKSRQMVFQGPSHQCSENRDCERWFKKQVPNYLKEGSSFECLSLSKTSKLKTCALVGSKGASCRLFEERNYSSKSPLAVRCGEGLKCSSEGPNGWLKNGQLESKPHPICL